MSVINRELEFSRKNKEGGPNLADCPITNYNAFDVLHLSEGREGEVR